MTAGCATIDHASHCAGWKPIYPSRDDALTDGTAKQIRAHDVYGVKSRCWSAPEAKKHP